MSVNVRQYTDVPISFWETAFLKSFYGQRNIKC